MFFRYTEPRMGKIVIEVTCLIMFSHFSMSRGLEFACTCFYCVLKGKTFFKQDLKLPVIVTCHLLCAYVHTCICMMNIDRWYDKFAD